MAAGADNKMRVMWAHNDGRLALWQVGSAGSLEVNNTYGPYGNWSPTSLAVGADGKMRVLWNNSDGTAAFWLVGFGDQTAGGGAIEVDTHFGPYTGWSARRIAVAADNQLRALWTNRDGTAALWVVGNSGALEVNNTYGPYPGWSASALAAGADDKSRILWNNANGQAALWQVATGGQSAVSGGVEVNLQFGPY